MQLELLTQTVVDFLWIVSRNTAPDELYKILMYYFNQLISELKRNKLNQTKKNRIKKFAELRIRVRVKSLKSPNNTDTTAVTSVRTLDLESRLNLGCLLLKNVSY